MLWICNDWDHLYCGIVPQLFKEKKINRKRIQEEGN
jgi:hypothetical protein